MAQEIGVAYVGCTHPHIFVRQQMLSALPDVRIVGAYDPDPALAAALQERLGIRPFVTPEDLLDHPDVTLAIVEGWDPDNPRYVRLAAERGRDVWLEKPGAPNLAAMRDLVRDLRDRDIVFEMGYMLRFSPVVPALRRILESGVLGPLTLARFHVTTPVGGSREPWQSVPGDLCGMLLTDCCHMFDLIIHLLGAPRAAKGMLLTLDPGPVVRAHGFKRDTLSELGETIEMPLGGLRYEDGAAALLDYGSLLATVDATGWDAQHWVEGWRLEFYGANGTLHAGVMPPWYRLFVRDSAPGHAPGWHTWKGSGTQGLAISLAPDAAYEAELRHTLRRVRTHDTAGNTQRLREAETIVAMVDAIYRSATEQPPMELAL